MMPLNDRFLQDLRSKLDIEEVISPYVNLKRRGKTYVGLCPFHSEKTGSFTVYPDTQSFYCFGCRAGGDAVSFIRRIENLDYVEAVKYLASSVGMPMPEDGFDDTLSKKRLRILSANREAAKFYHGILTSEKGKVGLEYFSKRGLTASTIAHFGLGFAPDEWTALTDHLRKLGYSYQEMVDASLAVKSSKSGRYFDFFRNRVMFPIIDVQGNVIAFGGRVMDDSKPKYRNSGDTLVFKKGTCIYGLNFAKNDNNGSLIIGEGYMDVISLHQAGFTNAVAGLGTALTENQAKLLSRYASERIYICYDSDGPGQKAAQSAISVLSATGTELRIILMDAGKDADEIIRSYGRERYKTYLDNACSVSEYQLMGAKSNFDLSTDAGKVSFLESACEILSRRDGIERDVYASRLASELNVSKEAILDKIKVYASRNRRREQSESSKDLTKKMTDFTDSNNPERSKNLRAARAEEVILSSFMRNPDFYIKLRDELKADDFVTSFNRRLFEAVSSVIDRGENADIIYFSYYFNPQEMSTVTRIFNMAGQLANTLEECRQCIATLKDCHNDTSVDVSEMSDEEYLKLFRRK